MAIIVNNGMEIDNLDDLVRFYYSELKCLLDSHAPEKTKTITSRINFPWYDKNLRFKKRVCRRSERRWVCTKSVINHDKFKEARNDYSKSLDTTKSQYLKMKFQRIGRIVKKLQNILNEMLGRKASNPLPEGSDSILAELFAEFFPQKIENIRNDLDNHSLFRTDKEQVGIMGQFKNISEEEVTKLVKNWPIVIYM